MQGNPIAALAAADEVLNSFIRPLDPHPRMETPLKPATDVYGIQVFVRRQPVEGRDAELRIDACAWRENRATAYTMIATSIYLISDPDRPAWRGYTWTPLNLAGIELGDAP